MGDLSDKLEDGLAQFAALDEELDAALKHMGLPGLSEAVDADGELSQLPTLMRLCTILPLSVRHTALRNALATGTDPNEKCPWGAMALDTLYADGDAVGLALLLDHGADAADYHWSDAHLAVIHNNHNDLTAMNAAALEVIDHPGDTPFLLACRLGRVAIAKQLNTGADQVQAALVAASSGAVDVVEMLCAEGVDVTALCDDGNSALLQAVEAGHVTMVQYLLEQGANVEAVRRVILPEKSPFERSEKLQAIVDKMLSAVATFMSEPSGPHETSVYDAAYDPAIVRLLVAYGADAAKFGDELFPIAIGVDKRPSVPLSRDEFAAQYRVRLGRTNPEAVDVPFWNEQIRTGQSAYQAKANIIGDDAEADGPVWSFHRFGRSATRLSDGLLVLIGGEHEDHYDPDFCIYNDVTVIAPDASITHYTYPVTAFPPTDFHTATQSDDGIWIIGNLGYPQHRLEGQTQVMWLSLIDFSIHSIATTGQSPGWIHGHQAQLHDGAIHISGGKVEPGYDDLAGGFVLDLKSRAWHAIN